jgi:hypothetical protein
MNRYPRPTGERTPRRWRCRCDRLDRDGRHRDSLHPMDAEDREHFLVRTRNRLTHLVNLFLQLIAEVDDEPLERTHGAAARKQAIAPLAHVSRSGNV